MHYSHYISKENYREHMMGALNDWNNNKKGKVIGLTTFPSSL